MDDLFNRLDKLNDDEYFESEFARLRTFYSFEGFDEVHEFIKNNRGFIILLNELKPMIIKYIPYAWRYLKLVYDPSYPTQLLLVLQAVSWDFVNGFKKDIRKLRRFANHLIKELNVNLVFFIWDCGFYDDIHCLGVLKPLHKYFSTNPLFQKNYFRE